MTDWHIHVGIPSTKHMVVQSDLSQLRFAVNSLWYINYECNRYQLTCISICSTSNTVPVNFG